jgi:hypothetical protein
LPGKLSHMAAHLEKTSKITPSRHLCTERCSDPFQPNYLAHPADLDVLLAGVKWGRGLAEQVKSDEAIEAYVREPAEMIVCSSDAGKAFRCVLVDRGAPPRYYRVFVHMVAMGLVCCTPRKEQPACPQKKPRPKAVA